MFVKNTASYRKNPQNASTSPQKAIFQIYLSHIDAPAAPELTYFCRSADSEKCAFLHFLRDVFNGVLLTESEYLKYEDKYINTIIEIASASGISYFTIGYAEKGNSNNQKLNLSPEMRGMLSKAAQGKRLNLSQTALYLRLLLREACWGVLVNERHYLGLSTTTDYILTENKNLAK